MLRTGGSTHSITILNLSGRTHKSAAGCIRKIPLLNWQEMGQVSQAHTLLVPSTPKRRSRRRTFRGNALSP